ncbi:MAG: hypothetical protein V4527_08500 [Pseudomonadota bacterium]
MILGMDWFTLTHVLISLVGIGTGLVLLLALMGGRNPGNWAALFLVFTLLTSVTGFFFHNEHITPAQITGVISLIALALAFYGLYGRGLAGIWRGTYVVSVTVGLYLNVFVLVIQSFLKIPPLHAIAPGTPPSGPVFLATQAVVLIAFIIAGWSAWRSFKPLKF